MIEFSVRKIWKTRSPRCPERQFSDIFHIKLSSFFAFNIKWSKWSHYQPNEVDCDIVVNLCVVYLVKPHSHLVIIKPSVIRKLAYKVKYISEINGGLIMVFQKFQNKTCLNFLAWLWRIRKESMQEKGIQSLVQCSKCYDYFHII